MKNAKLPLQAARVFKRSHISNPETWTFKRNQDQYQAILALLKESIKGTCYENAEPDQMVFYVHKEGTLLGNKLVSLNSVEDTEKGIIFVKEENTIKATVDGKLYLSDYESWREVRAPKAPKIVVPEPVQEEKLEAEPECEPTPEIEVPSEPTPEPKTTEDFIAPVVDQTLIISGM